MKILPSPWTIVIFSSRVIAASSSCARWSGVFDVFIQVHGAAARTGLDAPRNATGIARQTSATAVRGLGRKFYLACPLRPKRQTRRLGRVIRVYASRLSLENAQSWTS